MFSDKTSTPRTQGQSALSDSSFQWSSIHFTCFVGLQPQGIQPEYNPKPSGGFMGSQTLHVSPSSSGKDGNASSQTSIPPLYIRPRGDSAEYSLVHDPSVSPLLAHRNSGEAGRRNESIAPPAHTTPDALQESKISTGASETRDGLFDSDVSKTLALSQEDSGIEQTRLHGSHAILDPQSASQEDSAPAGGRHGLDVPLAPHPGHGQSGPGDDPSTDGSLSQDAGSVDAEGEFGFHDPKDPLKFSIRGSLSVGASTSEISNDSGGEAQDSKVLPRSRATSSRQPGEKDFQSLRQSFREGERIPSS